MLTLLSAGLMARQHAWQCQPTGATESAAINARLHTHVRQLTHAWHGLCTGLENAAMTRRALADVYQLFTSVPLRHELDSVPLYCTAASGTTAAPPPPLLLLALPPQEPQDTVLGRLAAAVPVATLDAFLLPMVWACEAPERLLSAALRCQATALQVRCLTLAEEGGDEQEPVPEELAPPAPGLDAASVVFREGHWTVTGQDTAPPADGVGPDADAEYVRRRGTGTRARLPALRAVQQLAEDDAVLASTGPIASLRDAQRAVAIAATAHARALVLAGLCQQFNARLRQQLLLGGRPAHADGENQLSPCYVRLEHAEAADCVATAMRDCRVKLTPAQVGAILEHVDASGMGPDAAITAQQQCAALVEAICADPRLGPGAQRALHKAGIVGL